MSRPVVEEPMPGWLAAAAARDYPELVAVVEEAMTRVYGGAMSELLNAPGEAFTPRLSPEAVLDELIKVEQQLIACERLRLSPVALPLAVRRVALLNERKAALLAALEESA